MQDLKNTIRHQDELLREQATLKEDISECLNKYKDCQERQKRKENQLQQLQREIEERKLELAKQEMVMRLRLSLSCLCITGGDTASMLLKLFWQKGYRCEFAI